MVCLIFNSNYKDNSVCVCVPLFLCGVGVEWGRKHYAFPRTAILFLEGQEQMEGVSEQRNPQAMGVPC